MKHFSSNLNTSIYYRVIVVIITLYSITDNLFAQCSAAFVNCPTTPIVIVDCDKSGDEPIDWPLILANPVGPCTNFILTQIAGPTRPAIVPLGTYLIRYLAEGELNGFFNGTNCSFFVSIIADNQSPIFTNCPPNITVNGTPDGSGSCHGVAFWSVPTATDDCSSLTVTSNFPCGYDFPSGSNTVSYTATDPSGNSGTCSFTVTVICSTPTETASKSYKEVIIHPNPTNESLIVDLGVPAISGESLRIVDFTGKILLNRSVQAGNPVQTIDTEHFQPGIYFIQITLHGRVQFVDKFIKL